MTVDLSAKTLPELQALVDNHRRLNRTDAPACRAASDEIERRKGGPLRLRTTVEAIHAVARGRGYISYGDVGKANGLSWAQARHRVTPHLNEVLDYAIDRGWPLVTAVVVDATGLGDGAMSAEALKGFVCSAAARGRFPGGEEAAFLRAEQVRTHDWARAWPGWS